ncbi:MAG: type II toxin-antitoxin system RelE/ParE family toxin [Nitrosarchaeum sp.]|nr:type II toxin-antitoxin system RelE/ParE family toxin [Nitrosarchaeum sp.]
MTWDIKWSPTANKQLQRIAKSNTTAAGQIVKRLEEIAEDPFNLTDKLHGTDLRKFRSGNYRVIVSLDEQKIIVFVVEVGSRSKIYTKY